ncbi:alanine racemase [Edaphobacter bradus]|uniref:alanine racemase n=1 Tax=Edaphobacter bradus TaxID=2259016 RepID=UPI0021E0E3CC|nr:alanine racemase [Edaphobacter bradus]
MNSWVELSESRLAANYRALAEMAGVEVMAVIKADAYGHGAPACAPALARAGARWLGVADVAEGVAVLASLAGVEPRPRILIMSGLLPEDAPAIVEHDFAPVVWTLPQLESLAVTVSRAGAAPLGVHLEIDSGMSRQGVAPGPEFDGILAWLVAHPQLTLEGLMTHFASAEIAGSPQTTLQRERFEQACRAVAASGLRPAWVHAGNTSTIDNGAEADPMAWLARVARTLSARPMVRSGIGLYGYSLPIERAPGFSGPVAARVHDRLQPVMTWKTRVMALSDVAPGEAVGYNGAFIAQRAMRLALLPVGYSDGLRRSLSATNGSTGGWVLINGQRANIVGRISMNLTVVDVTGLSGVNVGDEAVLLGDGITADDHASIAGTISYEILCGVRARQRLA